MVALIVRLKLRLLRNNLRRSVWRTVGLILGMLYALAVVVAVVAGLVALRWTSAVFTADLTVVCFSVLTIGWTALSVLVFGVDETVDPGKFALLPVPARRLLPGMFVAGLVGSPGIATVLVGLGLVATWTRSVLLTAAAVPAFVLGVATCFLLARTATSGLAQALASRRFRDFAAVAIALFGAVVGLIANAVGNYSGFHPELMRQLLGRAAAVLGWTPFGWAWAIPAEVARGRLLLAGVRLVLAAALVVGLWRAWAFLLDRSLTSPLDGGGGGSRKVSRNRSIDRLFPATPAGAVAARAMRYWRRDPRYLTALASICVAPVVLVVTQLANPHGFTPIVSFAPVTVSLFLGSILASDLSYDGSAIWTHVSSGVSGADDRRGRVMSTSLVIVPLVVVMVVATTLISGRVDYLPQVVAVLLGLGLIGLGVGSWSGAIWQVPTPPPGSSPFARNEGGGVAALISFGVTTGISIALALPVLALVVGSFFLPWLKYPAVAVGAVLGAVVLRIGIAKGGAALERRWPEVLTTVSSRN